MLIAYQTVLALHIVSIVAWMAGILYLYRLFVYHAEETEAVVKARFQIMERRLYQYITLPAMVASLTFGITLVLLQPAFLKMGWLHLKLACVVGMIAMTLYGGTQIQNLAAGRAVLRSRTYRILNEVPTLLLLIIVFMVVLKPF